MLFLCDPAEDYVADSLFHGLRSVLGAGAVDFPKREKLYRSYPADRRGALYGRGFSIYAELEDLRVDREGVFERAAGGGFDLVVVGAIWRDWHWWLDVERSVPSSVRRAVVDGADVSWMYPYGPTWWRSPRGWFLRRAHRRAAYFKREWTRTTGWLRWYGLFPGSVRLHPIAISYPEDKVLAAPPNKEKEFTAHVVDPEVASRLDGARTGYAFTDERDYVADLRRSRFGVTTRKAGWDAMRHYEIAANGCLPCFRHLERKPPRCAPHGLEPGVNCLSYSDATDLLRQTGDLAPDRYAELRAGALNWARANTTVRRAEEFLARALS